MKASAANFVALLVSWIGVHPAAAGTAEKLDPVYDAALAGDGEKALEVLSRIDPASLDAAESDRASCIRRNLDGFVSFGWAGYATCNRYHTAGWATDTALFAVKSAYGNLASEDFKVSYLAHESRHFSDKRRFPKLEAPELEYRAKLTELALARQTLYDLVTTFARRGGSDRADPHGFANRRVTKDLSREIFHVDVPVDDAARWRTVPAQDIRNAARRLLARNDALLKQKGADRVERALGE